MQDTDANARLEIEQLISEGSISASERRLTGSRCRRTAENPSATLVPAGGSTVHHHCSFEHRVWRPEIHRRGEALFRCVGPGDSLRRGFADP